MKIALELIENPWYKHKLGCICDGCAFDSICLKNQECINMNCEDGKYIYKVYREYEPCAKENTKVGDVVLDKESGMECLVKYILKDVYIDQFILEKDRLDHLCIMDMYKIEKR